MQAEAVPQKKRPGRPPKLVVAMPIEIHGIVKQPADETNIIELEYHNPAMFKKLVQLFKQFAVSEVEMNFELDGLKIITKDHLGKSTIYTTIIGEYMSRYYCAQPTRVCVNRDNLERVLGGINKNHYNITINLKENYRSIMYMVIKDIEYNSENSYEIDVVFKPEENQRDAILDDDTEYPIKLRISSKHFKSLLNDVRKLSPIITLQKVGDQPIQFTFPKAQKVNWAKVYNDAAKLNIKNSLGADEIFTVSVNIDYIKPFANGNISDDVYLAAHQTKKMSFMALLDKKGEHHSAFVKIYTEIGV